MARFYQLLFSTMWIAWLLFWWLRSRDAKTTARRESIVSRLSYVVPLLVSVLLLWPLRLPIPLLSERFLPLAQLPLWLALGAVLNFLGLLFSIWAREHLGRNWSGTVTIKEGHELITSGPYRFVRHPIYTGLMLAFIGLAIARGEWLAILAVALALGSFWRKLRLEERWMRE